MPLPPIIHHTTLRLSLSDIMRECQHQHGTDALIEAILEFCCDSDTPGFEFEDKLIATLTKFKAANT